MSVSRYMLERYATGDLTEAERAVVEAELAANPEAKARVEALRAEQASFLADNDYGRFLGEHEKRKQRRTRLRWIRFALPSFVLAAAAVLLYVAQPNDERVKGGGVGLRIALVNSEAPRTLTVGEQVHPGDRLQPAYDAGDHGYVALLGRDASGTVSVYFPADGASAMAPLPAGAHGLFPLSLTLDGALGAETFVAVFADTPLPLGEVREAVAKSAKAPGMTTATLTFEKVQ